MTWFDYTVLIIVGASALVAVIRGFVREILSLASWVIAFVAASALAGTVAPLLPSAIPNDALAMLAAFLLVFGGTLLAMSVIALAITEFIKGVGLGFVDRVLGLMFGLARGLLVVTITVLLAGLTRLPENPGWRDAMLSSPLEALALSVKPWLPPELARRIRYEPVRQVVRSGGWSILRVAPERRTWWASGTMKCGTIVPI
ncbi:MAG: CvpA family protein [Proteobacteria bacterium]|nr:CvpA family protein [Burkholderiales bacterium]